MLTTSESFYHLCGTVTNGEHLFCFLLLADPTHHLPTFFSDCPRWLRACSLIKINFWSLTAIKLILEGMIWQLSNYCCCHYCCCCWHLTDILIDTYILATYWLTLYQQPPDSWLSAHWPICINWQMVCLQKVVDSLPIGDWNVDRVLTEFQLRFLWHADQNVEHSTTVACSKHNPLFVWFFKILKLIYIIIHRVRAKRITTMKEVWKPGLN